MSKQKSYFDLVNENKVYFYPLILPVLIYHAIAAVVFLLQFLQAVLVALVILFGLGFMVGIVGAIFKHELIETVVKSRLSRIIITIKWGSELTAWILKEGEN